MGSVRIVIDGQDELLAKLRKLGDSAQAHVELATTIGAEFIRDEAIGRAPGPEIKQVMVERSASTATAHVGPDRQHWYYRFFETGAGGHGITGNQYLAFVGSQGFIITRSVQHPGVTAAPFLRPAIQGNKDEIARRMGAAFRRAIDEVAG